MVNELWDNPIAYTKRALGMLYPYEARSYPPGTGMKYTSRMGGTRYGFGYGAPGIPIPLPSHEWGANMLMRDMTAPQYPALGLAGIDFPRMSPTWLGPNRSGSIGTGGRVSKTLAKKRSAKQTVRA